MIATKSQLEPKFSSKKFKSNDSLVDNYAAPLRQASKLTAASDEDQTEAGTL